jgi:CheY-like chemotaxis protein
MTNTYSSIGKKGHSMGIALLVTDDSKLSRRNAIKSLPPELTFDITEAANGREAMEALSKQSYQLLLLDLTMPEIDGIGVLEFLLEQPSGPDVIVVSADLQPDTQRIVIALGARKFLEKPIASEALAMTLFELGYL